MKKKIVRPTLIEQIEGSAMQNYAHQHTATIASRRRVLEFQAGEVERAIIALNASLSNRKRALNQLTAQIRGLTAVIGKR